MLVDFHDDADDIDRVTSSDRQALASLDKHLSFGPRLYPMVSDRSLIDVEVT